MGDKTQVRAPTVQSRPQMMRSVRGVLGAGGRGRGGQLWYNTKMNMTLFKCAILEVMIQVFPHYISITYIRSNDSKKKKKTLIAH